MSVMIILNEAILAAPNRTEKAGDVGGPTILIKKGDRHVRIIHLNKHVG
jgi:hypothetical protein